MRLTVVCVLCACSAMAVRSWGQAPRSDDETVRWHIRHALEYLAASDPASDDSVWTSELAFAMSTSGDAISLLDRLLTDRDPAIRKLAAIALDRHHVHVPLDPNARLAVRPLMEMLDDDDVHERIRAAKLLGHLGQTAKSAAPRLIELMESWNVALRSSSAESLGKITTADDKPAVAALVTGLSDKFPEVRAASASGLCSLGESTDAAPALLPHLLDPDYRVRSAVWQGVLDFKPETRAKAVKLLGERPDDKDTAATAEAEIALAALRADKSKTQWLVHVRFDDTLPLPVRHDAWLVLKRLDPQSDVVDTAPDGPTTRPG